jgi:hypothetical protein
MPILQGCCCFVSLKTGSRACAWFTFIFAICNIAIDIDALIRIHSAEEIMEPQEQYIYLPPGILALAYIELFLSIVMFALGIVLLIGINYEFEGKKLLYTWVIGVVIDRLYDIFLGVYIMVWIGGHRFMDVIYVVPESVVIAVYWLLNSIILIAAILCVMSYWQELQDLLFGKERRIKYHRKLANIRTAALSGYTTPYKSYYSSRSMLQLSQSQASISSLPDA